MRTLLVLTGVLLFAIAGAGVASAAGAPDYVGAAGCTSKCHKKQKDGDQRSAWQKSDHAKAYTDLATDEAKEAAEKVGVSGDPQQSAACLVCHTTGFGEQASRFRKKFKLADGVQCEACHGAGSDYDSKRKMKAIVKERGPDKKNPSPTAQATGMVFPDENTCKRCHAPEIKFNGKIYKNPKYDEEFEFDESFEEIAHPLPEGRRQGKKR